MDDGFLEAMLSSPRHRISLPLTKVVIETSGMRGGGHPVGWPLDPASWTILHGQFSRHAHAKARVGGVERREPPHHVRIVTCNEYGTRRVAQFSQLVEAAVHRGKIRQNGERPVMLELVVEMQSVGG